MKKNINLLLSLILPFLTVVSCSKMEQGELFYSNGDYLLAFETIFKDYHNDLLPSPDDYLNSLIFNFETGDFDIDHTNLQQKVEFEGTKLSRNEYRSALPQLDNTKPNDPNDNLVKNLNNEKQKAIDFLANNLNLEILSDKDYIYDFTPIKAQENYEEISYSWEPIIKNDDWFSINLSSKRYIDFYYNNEIRYVFNQKAIENPVWYSINLSNFYDILSWLLKNENMYQKFFTNEQQIINLNQLYNLDLGNLPFDTQTIDSGIIKIQPTIEDSSNSTISPFINFSEQQRLNIATNIINSNLNWWKMSGLNKSLDFTNTPNFENYFNNLLKVLNLKVTLTIPSSLDKLEYTIYKNDDINNTTQLKNGTIVIDLLPQPITNNEIITNIFASLEQNPEHYFLDLNLDQNNSNDQNQQSILNSLDGIFNNSDLNLNLIDTQAKINKSSITWVINNQNNCTISFDYVDDAGTTSKKSLTFKYFNNLSVNNLEVFLTKYFSYDNGQNLFTVNDNKINLAKPLGLTVDKTSDQANLFTMLELSI